ncbi:DUF4435 domain-containing protein [Sphingobacterium sp. UDSM-2020]|uniref:DUF4435 domain-containing protein n=1 Tax=Sphingobacterium sp. UDSM-2020 TaxID=2795738 RepID=UPI00193855E3|nr:DUF4435 domain-containing protein [Sphingobacterium sp. UDSM-2020]QQD13145.1 DUF4435 domain-containing protein [Sphingobacterium sp. UDSM-2020]
MVSRIDTLRAERESSSSVYLQILRMSKDYPDSLLCCFEGEDFKYYGIRIENLALREYDKIRPVKCKGKENVLKVYNLIAKISKLNKANILYFVDRDFDKPLIGYTNLYETPYYSIENFYITSCTIEKIIENEFKVDAELDIFKYILEIFTRRFQDFHTGISYLNAWIYCQRQDKSIKLNLSDFKLTSVFESITLEELNFIKYDRLYLEKIFPKSKSVPDVEIEQAKVILESKPYEKFRGKFEVDFLHIMIELLISSVKRRTSPFNTIANVSLVYSRKNVLSELSQYAYTPKCLKDFIKVCA